MNRSLEVLGVCGWLVVRSRFHQLNPSMAFLTSQLCLTSLVCFPDRHQQPTPFTLLCRWIFEVSFDFHLIDLVGFHCSPHAFIPQTSTIRAVPQRGRSANCNDGGQSADSIQHFFYC